MEVIRKLAIDDYKKASEKEKESAHDLFRKLDRNGNGKVSLMDLKESMKWMLSHDKAFEQLDADGNGTLDFEEVLALHYAFKVGIPLCDGCWCFLPDTYFSCSHCLGKGQDAYFLCSDCYIHGKVQHHHSLIDFLDHHSELTMWRKRLTDQKSTRGKTEIEELSEIARAHYRAGSPEIQALAHEFFNSMDSNGDGQISLPEFLGFMRQQSHFRMNNPYFFRELDKDGNGTLDFWEVMTVYYIIKSGRPFCDWCGNFIPGLFFSCVECFKTRESSFNLCRDCYGSTKCNHNHNGRSQFLDNYTLLEANRDSVLAHSTGLYQNNQPNYNTYIVHPPSSWPNTSTEIVPAPKVDKVNVALKTFEMALAIGNVASTMCTIL